MYDNHHAHRCRNPHLPAQHRRHLKRRSSGGVHRLHRANPDAGDVIPGTGGLRKVRWTRPGMGKRGGARVIYLRRNARGQVLLLIAYAKAKFDNLPTEFLNRLREQYDV